MASPTFILSLVFIYFFTGVIYYYPKSLHHHHDERNDYTINCQPPEQIHLSVTGKPDERVITFVVQSSSCPKQAHIRYGISPNDLNQSAQVQCKEFDAGHGRMLSILHSKVTAYLLLSLPWLVYASGDIVGQNFILYQYWCVKFACRIINISISNVSFHDIIVLMVISTLSWLDIVVVTSS